VARATFQAITGTQNPIHRWIQRPAVHHGPGLARQVVTCRSSQPRPSRQRS
jgi:hypothetical protein